MLHTRSGSDTDFCPMIKPHILVAEIDIVLLNGLARALRENGYQTSKASGVIDLQSNIEKIGVDLILMDCLLLARSRDDFSAYAARKALPVILMSGNRRDIAQYRSPFQLSLTKPFRIKQLLALIESVFGPAPVRGVASFATFQTAHRLPAMGSGHVLRNPVEGHFRDPLFTDGGKFTGATTQDNRPGRPEAWKQLRR